MPFADEHALGDIYAYPFGAAGHLPYRIFSKDADDPNYRAGIIGMFFEQGGHLFANTAANIFCKAWKGLEGGGLTSPVRADDELKGKVATLYTRNPAHAAFCTTKDPEALVIGRKFGTVLGLSLDGMMVILKIEDWVRSDPQFLAGGQWLGVAMPGDIKVGVKVVGPSGGVGTVAAIHAAERKVVVANEDEE